MLDNGVKCVSMEVSSGGIMQNRVEDVDFDVAIFSNLSPDHIGPKEHPTFEHYLQCKARLFKMAKHGIINIDDKYAETDSTKASKYMFEKAKVQCIKLEPKIDKIEIKFK